MSERGLFVRALGAFLALPGVVAGLVPLLIGSGALRRFDAASAAVFLLPGLGLLLWCVREFYVAGKGTLAPWSPPRHLVVSGPYRWSRNPMYVAVLLALVGWAIGFRAVTLAGYAAAVAIAFHVRVVFGEEPWLARTHGEAWVEYRRRTRRWI